MSRQWTPSPPPGPGVSHASIPLKRTAGPPSPGGVSHHPAERLELAGGPAAGPGGGAALPPEVLEIARQATAFLDAAEDRRAAVRALRRGWKQTLILAAHDLGKNHQEEIQPG